MKTPKHARRLGTAAITLAMMTMALVAIPASAASPTWRLSTGTPDSINAGKHVLVDAWVENVGDVPLTGNLTIADTFPAGITPANPEIEGTLFGSSCQDTGQTSTCTVNVDGMVPGAQVRFRYLSQVDPSATGALVNSITVAGGGMADPATSEQAMTVGPPGPFGIKTFGMSIGDASNDPTAQAGSAPKEADNTLRLLTVESSVFPEIAPLEHLKNTVVHVPAGFVGNPTATPARCTAGQLTAASPNDPTLRIPDCPQDSQVGIAHVVTHAPGLGPDIVPVYNMVPRLGAPAEFGFSYDAITVEIVARVRPDNGIDLVVRDAPSSVAISEVDVTLWGVPADRSHDNQRGVCLENYMGNFQGETCPTSARPAPFLRLPTSCTDNPLPWSVDLTTYVHPDPPGFHADTTTPRIEGCQYLPFDPSFSLVPSVKTPHTPSGLDVKLRMPQDTSPTGLAEADVQRTTVTLPDGMTINPSSADGLQACTDDQLNLGRDGVSTCPDGSKIGTVTLTSPLLDHPVDGSVFLRTQASDDPLSGNLFRIAIEVRSDNDGIDLKLPGSIRADPFTGQLTTTFDQLPQLPFSALDLHFKTGARAPLTTSRTCGPQTTSVELASWSDKLVDTTDSFNLSGDGNGAPCSASGFAPAFTAGSQNPVAGASTPFLVSLDRSDNDQLFKGLTVYSPTGLLGRIRSADLCPEAAANAGTCGDGSLIGSSIVGAGTGPNPFFVSGGKVFLTGPYHGAPYGLSVVTRAIAGPFDLGTVVVRAAVNLDRRTAQLQVTSDAFPTIVKGVPLNLRSIRLSIDKPGFMVNPTNCGVKQVLGTATSTEGASASLGSRYQVGNCRNLGFSPKLSMTVGSVGHTSAGSSAPLSATLTQPAGQSNLREVKVMLPAMLDAHLAVVTHACTLAQFSAGNCRRAEIGSATAVSPLLRRPLRGGAFFVKHPGRPLPDIMVALRGEVSIDLVGKVSIVHSTYLVTDFAVPDAPVTKFTLNLVSGATHGPLGVVTNLCTKKARTATTGILMRGQNGASISVHQRMHIRGC